MSRKNIKKYTKVNKYSTEVPDCTVEICIPYTVGVTDHRRIQKSVTEVFVVSKNLKEILRIYKIVKKVVLLLQSEVF